MNSTVIALLYILQLTLLLSYSIVSLFFNIAKVPKIISPIVVVFIPPPVDPGEAPINIRITNNSEVDLFRPKIEMVLNPAVLVVTL